MEKNLRRNTISDIFSSSIPLPANSSAVSRSNQPSDDISNALGGDQITNEETESLNKNVSYRRNCYDSKVKEMTGNGIFSETAANPNYMARRHYHQPSQISFGSEESVTLKKRPTALTEAAKQQEFSVTLQTKATDIKSKKKQISITKTKDINGDSSLFSAQQEVKGNRAMADIKGHSSLFSAQQEVKENRAMEEPTPKEVTNFGGGRQNKKLHELTSNDIIKDDTVAPPGCVQKQQSSAKRREMSGHDIFADGKSEYRDHFGGRSRPPGGESSLSLV